MRRLIFVLLLLVPVLAFGQTDAALVGGKNKLVNPEAACFLNPSGSPIPVSAANPLPVTSSGGGGGGDASAANQTTQITAEQAIQATLGAKTDAKSTATDTTSISLAQILKQISASVQAPPSQAVTNIGTFPVQASINQTTPGNTNAVQSKQYTGTPSNFTIGTTDATVFTLAAGEVGFIQNLSDKALAVKKGSSASSSSFSYLLAGGAAASDGTGGAVRIDDWIGAVSVASMSGTASYIAWKQAP